uniref:Thyroglobulin type-1 domain-containing protein n=1 Tax=Timema genevievae TaxID=629358 RepID=A0A7R9PMJ6_TIMGE|nr:unnamed protein product [Timema genevievae]
MFKTEYNRKSPPPSTEDMQVDLERAVLNWKFSSLDLNGDDYLSSVEYKDLSRMVRKAVKPKKCSKVFTKLCDKDEDQRISRDEWAFCLGLDFNPMFGGGLMGGKVDIKPTRGRGGTGRVDCGKKTDCSESIGESTCVSRDSWGEFQYRRGRRQEQVNMGGRIRYNIRKANWKSLRGVLVLPPEVKEGENVNNAPKEFTRRDAKTKQNWGRGGGSPKLVADPQATCSLYFGPGDNSSTVLADVVTVRAMCPRYESREDAGGERLSNGVLQESIPTITGSLPGFGDDTIDSKDELEANDCLSDRQAVQEELLAGNTELYVPECTPDGRFQKTQCYKSTGECVTHRRYCWCVQEDGKPIPGTSIKNKDPNCDSVPTPSRPMPGCPEAKKLAFLEELMSFMTKKMQAATNKSATTESGIPLIVTWDIIAEEKVATWNFNALDKNNNKILEKKEWKNFRALISSNRQLRRCGKRLPRYCDTNHDRKISLSEWLNCLNAQRTNPMPSRDKLWYLYSRSEQEYDSPDG